MTKLAKLYVADGHRSAMCVLSLPAEDSPVVVWVTREGYSESEIVHVETLGRARTIDEAREIIRLAWIGSGGSQRLGPRLVGWDGTSPQAVEFGRPWYDERETVWVIRLAEMTDADCKRLGVTRPSLVKAGA